MTGFGSFQKAPFLFDAKLELKERLLNIESMLELEPEDQTVSESIGSNKLNECDSFLEVKDVDKLLWKLRQIWVGSYKLRVDLARKIDYGFGRNRVALPNSLKDAYRLTRVVRGGRSYKEVVENFKPDKVDTTKLG
ncbi:hypothetical protein Ancab_013613 [Ancistrocladus abbreviatus]